MMDNYILIHNEKEHRYEFQIEGLTPFIEYEKHHNVLHLTRTIVPEELSGRGIARILCIAVMKEIETQGLKMKPKCSYIVSFIEKYPAYQRLLEE